MDIWANFIQNMRMGGWVILYWLVFYNAIGHFTKKRAVELPHNWVTWIDDQIPYFPYAFDIIYYVGFVLPCLPYFFVANPTNTWIIIWAYFFTLSFSFVVFIIWPVQMWRPKTSKTPLMKLVHKYDSPSNCIPSVHCSYATLPVLSALLVGWNAWPVLIGVGAWVIASTVFTKQHYLVDSIAGIGMAILGFGVSYIIVPMVL